MGQKLVSWMNLLARMGLVVFCEQCNGLALLACTTCPADAVDVVFDGQGELCLTLAC